MVAQLGHEEVLSALFLGKRKSLLAAVGRIHVGIFNVVVRYVVTLHPGAEVSVGHVVLGLTRADTVAATDTFWQVDQHAPPMLAHGVVGGGFRGSGKDIFPGDGRRRQQKQHVAPGKVHFVPPVVSPAVMAGLWGWWQVSQASPLE